MGNQTQGKKKKSVSLMQDIFSSFFSVVNTYGWISCSTGVGGGGRARKSFLQEKILETTSHQSQQRYHVLGGDNVALLKMKIGDVHTSCTRT